jgi:hypothetical protein
MGGSRAESAPKGVRWRLGAGSSSGDRSDLEGPLRAG